MQYISPISIQFIWHPKDEQLVSPIVDYCKKNLSKKADKPFLHSLDFPIFTYTSKSEIELPSEINTMAEKSLAFAFISDNIVSSDKWVKYTIHQSHYDNVKMIPIALTGNAFNIPEISRINAIRYYENKDKYSDEELKQRIFITIAHEIYRWLLNIENNNKLKLFISHTKKDEDGLKLAIALKTFIEQDTTIEDFFDTNDIQIGNEFDDEIANNIKASTLIVIHSDTYSSRYWCQKEIICAKENERPIVAVDLMNTVEDRSFPLMCNYPTIRYNGNLLDILELSMLETIRFHYCRKLFESYKNGGYIPKDATMFNCIPDSFLVNNADSDLIIYPEPEMYPEEKELLAYDKTLETPLSYNSINVSQKSIGLSISDVSSDELISLGQDSSNLKKLSQMIAQKVLRNGAKLIYGGDLRNDGYTQLLFDEAEIIQSRTLKDDILIKDYISWPIHLSEEKEFISLKAKYRKVCEFERMEQSPDIEGMYNADTFISHDTTEGRYAWSRCLTFMRDKMINECDIRISAGGKTIDYLGCMPGVLEEIFFAVQNIKPVYLLGGFGGISAKVCNFLKTGIKPNELTLEWQKENNTHYSELLDEYKKHGLSIDYSWIDKLSIKSLNNGLSQEDNLRLFDTPFPDEAVCLIAQGIRNIHNNF